MRCRHGDARAGTPRAARRTWPGKHGSYAAQNRRFRRGAQDGKSGRWRAAHLRGRARRKLQDAEAASRQLLQKGVFAKDLGEIPNSPASTALAASARTAVVVSRFPDPAEIGMKVSGSGHPVVEWAAPDSGYGNGYAYRGAPGRPTSDASRWRRLEGSHDTRTTLHAGRV